MYMDMECNLVKMEETEQKHSGPTEVARTALATFPFSKTTCVCNCGKYNLQDLPVLRKILPEGYAYKLCEYLPLDREDKFLVTLRMTLATQEEALEWKRRFEEKSLTTHVKDKTFPKVERVSIFKAQYRCQFFDRRKTKKKLPEKSKFRDCRSILFINIKKFFKNTVDRHMPTYQTVVRLHYAHDHSLDTADVLKKRQLNEDIKYRFLEMFRQGMKPKDALDKHKRELLQNLGPEKYRQVVCDGYYVPNVPKTYRLYYQIHGKGVSAKTTTKRSSKHNPNPDWIAFQNCSDVTPADSDEDCDAVENDSGNIVHEDGDRGTAVSNGTVISSGTVVNNGTVVSSGTVVNNGTVVSSGTVINSGTVVSSGTIVNSGTVVSNGTVINSGTVTSNGTVISKCKNDIMQHQQDVVISYQGVPELQNEQRILASRTNVNGASLTHSTPAVQSSSLVTKSNTNNVTTHNLESHTEHQLVDMSTAYTNIPPHYPPYLDARGKSLPCHTMSGSSACGVQFERDIFNLAQPSWEHFSTVQQQSTAGSMQQSHNHSFQDVNLQNSSSYMILPRSSYNSSSHFVSAQENADQNMQLLNTVPQVPTDVNMTHSSCNHLYSPWGQARFQYNVDSTQVNCQPQISHAGKVLSPEHISNQIQTAGEKTMCTTLKKKKKKPIKDLNMKHVTKRWMDKKPKVEAETQNLASEVLQTILLADEAEKLKVRLLTFLSDLETKMMTNPKLFVPAVRHFLNAGENTKDHIQLVSFLKDFGKTEEIIVRNLEAKRKEYTQNHSTQTRLSGPVFKIGNVKLKNQKVLLNKYTNKAATINQMPQSQLVLKQKSAIIRHSLYQAKKSLQNGAANTTLGSCISKQTNSSVGNRNNQECHRKLAPAETLPSAFNQHVKKSLTKSFREKQSKRIWKQKCVDKCRNQGRITMDKQNFCPESSLSLCTVADVTPTSSGLAQKLIVKFSCIRQTS